MKKTIHFYRYISMNILGMLGAAVTILTDTFFVADKLGVNGLAALNLTICILGLINGLGILFILWNRNHIMFNWYFLFKANCFTFRCRRQHFAHGKYLYENNSVLCSFFYSAPFIYQFYSQ